MNIFSSLGGPGQMPHLAPTYAAICALCIAGIYYPEAYNLIDRYLETKPCLPPT